MGKYIIKNCPAYNEKGCLHSAAIFPDESMQNHYITFAVPCQDCTDCLLKRIYEDVKTVYRTPEYFEELAKKGDKEQETIESCWHNVSHMVISKLDVQEEMSEVEKMYKLANLKAISIAEYGSTYISQPLEINGKLYPPFTAEKQLSLIKLLSKHLVHIDYDNGKYEVSISSIGNLRYDYYDTLEETLAYCINNLWQDLSEEEHKQIKEILE